MKNLFSLLYAVLLFTPGLHSQTPSPGGVSSPELWFKTVPQSDNLQGRYIWRDFGGDSVKLRRYDSRGASYGSEYSVSRDLIRTYNFNPALSLSGLDSINQFALSNTNLSQSTVISVWGPGGDFDQDMFLYLLNGRSGGGYILTKDKIIHSNESGRANFDYGKEEGKDLLYQTSDEEANLSGFREKALKVATYNRILQPSTPLWGERDQAVVGIGGIFRSSYSSNTSTFNTGELNNRSFIGYAPEFIVYNRMLTPLERRKAETYLALKYGLTLELSYISSKDMLIWDMDENAGFNNRVTGYGRDDASGLHQKTATTSYEESPYYSDASGNTHDSHDGNNSYNLPSRYRLLVIGRQPASPVRDGDFILFGDNDETITARETEDVNGIKLMSRRWLVDTNMPPASEQEKQFEWNAQGLDIYTEGFRTKATKAGNAEDDYGALVTQTPLLEKDGYFSWVIVSSRRGPLTVKFGTSNPGITGGANDYGYYVSDAGQVYRIIKGVMLGTAVETLSVNQKTEVGKEGNTVYLRVNGVRKYTGDIQIEEAYADNDYYGSIMISKHNNEDIVLSDIRQGGFSDTGNSLELSYIAERASEFANYRAGGKSYLVIDRTGTGDFSSGNTEYIPSDEMDESRYKIIFNNVFWDTDGNGRDMFTFGYRPNNLAAVITSYNPTCLNDSSLNDGSIEIQIKHGFKGFSYRLTNTETQETVSSGTFYTDSLKIDSLSAGSYDLTLAELGGFNLYPKQPGSFSNMAIGSTYFNSTSNAYLEWIHTGDAKASAGMSIHTALQSRPDGQTIGYGLYAGDGGLYRIDNGTIDQSPLAGISEGDSIRVERVSDTIYYKLNGRELLSTGMRTEDLARYNYPCVAVSGGGVYNLTWNRMPLAASWITTDNLAMEKSTGDSIVQTVTLESDCNNNLRQAAKEPEVPQMSDIKSDGGLTVYYKDKNNTQDVTAKIEQPEPEPVSLMLFDAGGRHILSIDIPEGGLIETADMHLPVAGMYVIKAFTSRGEYTAKVVSR